MNGRPRTTSGFSLIEAAIVLGIVGLVIGGIWVAAAAVNENMRTSRMAADVLTLVQNIRKIYSPRIPLGGMTDLSSAQGWASGVYNGTTSFSRGSSFNKDPWGDDMILLVGDNGVTVCSGCGSSIEVGFFGGVTQKRCLALTSALTRGLRNTSDLLSVMMGHDDGSTSTVTPPATTAAIAAACQEPVEMELYFLYAR